MHQKHEVNNSMTKSSIYSGQSDYQKQILRFLFGSIIRPVATREVIYCLQPDYDL